MPNAVFSVYLTDQEYINFLSKKKEIQTQVRELVKENVKEKEATKERGV